MAHSIRSSVSRYASGALHMQHSSFMASFLLACAQAGTKRMADSFAIMRDSSSYIRGFVPSFIWSSRISTDFFPISSRGCARAVSLGLNINIKIFYSRRLYLSRMKRGSGISQMKSGCFFLCCLYRAVLVSRKRPAGEFWRERVQEGCGRQ